MPRKDGHSRMCGICGFALTRPVVAADERALVAMRDTLVHRGPDDQGLYIDDRVGLGHRRLSIIDVAGGHQPMSSDAGDVHIVYNGEVYNHLELRRWLEGRGHRFRTRCDTEAILRMYQEEGPASINKLRGMFAYAVWDVGKRELVLVRDRFGIKPLYYFHAPDGSLYFASEMKSLFVGGALAPELNAAAVPDYLANHGTTAGATLFRHVHRLMPGSFLRWRDGQLEVQQYWDLEFAPAGEAAADEREVLERFRTLFTDAVRMRLMSDVPLGMFLSGGIDSSAIVAVMSRLVSEPIKTFSVAFADREANEHAYARLVARTFGTDHHEIVLTPEEFFAQLPSLIWHEDEPLAFSASVPLYFVSKLAAGHVKVVLTGEGADETLAGYYRYWKTLYNLSLADGYERVTGERVRTVIRRGVAGLPLGSYARRKLVRTFLYRPSGFESLFFDNFAVFPRALQTEVLAPDFRAQLPDFDPYANLRAHRARADGASRLSQLLYVDCKTYLHELLMKQDQMSMATSIESRVPFLDHELAEFVAGLPDRMKLRGRTTKYLLRRSFADVLPREILTRPKMGFPVPLAEWFRGPFKWVVDEFVLGDEARRRGIFDPAAVRELVGRHMGRAEDHGERLWALVNFEIWQRQFIDGAGARAAEPRVTAIARS